MLCLHKRAFPPWMSVTSLLHAFAGDKVNTIACLHRCFNGLQLTDAHLVAYNPLRKSAFAQLMKALVEQTIALRISAPILPK